MDEILQNFSVDLPGLIAQVVNFLIVFAVLWFFAMKPLKKIMDDRTNKIEKSLKDADKIGEELKATEEKKAEELKKAKQEALAIIEAANKTAEKNKQELVVAAETEVGKVKDRAKVEIQGAKETMLKEAQTELADLVVAAVKKVVDKDLSDDDNKILIAKTIKEVQDENK